MQKRQRGQSLSGYLLILGLIAVTSIAVVGTLGSTIRSQVAAMTQELAGMDSSGASAISTANAACATADLGLDQLRQDNGQ
ncbi:MAG: hypothetical protein PVJ90_01315 [Pseudomonadales bacterium]|jgi:L-lactate utilization protein LutC